MRKLKVRLFFLIGKNRTPMPKSVAEEIEKFDDVIIGDFFDSYQNLTLKTWTGHRFVNSKYFKDCQTADWVIFHDDDAFVDYYQVKTRLNKTIRFCFRLGCFHNEFVTICDNL